MDLVGNQRGVRHLQNRADVGEDLKGPISRLVIGPLAIGDLAHHLISAMGLLAQFVETILVHGHSRRKMPCGSDIVGMACRV